MAFPSVASISPDGVAEATRFRVEPPPCTFQEPSGSPGVDEVEHVQSAGSGDRSRRQPRSGNDRPTWHRATCRPKINSYIIKVESTGKVRASTHWTNGSVGTVSGSS